MRYYCRHCQERLKVDNGVYVLVKGTPYVDSTKCKSTGGGHEPR